MVTRRLREHSPSVHCLRHSEIDQPAQLFEKWRPIGYPDNFQERELLCTNCDSGSIWTTDKALFSYRRILFIACNAFSNAPALPHQRPTAWSSSHSAF